jgi:phytoene synthase
MTPDQYCQEKAVKSGSSFYYSFLYLPSEKRRAITALYAFCREVDDIVDECTEESVARMKLAWWRQEIISVYSAEQGKKPSHPVAKSLVAVIKTINLSASQLIEIIDGMEMDLDCNRYADFSTLKLYCHHVAGVVGQLSAEIFGYQDPKTLEYAHNLGLAFQLTNIIRDVGEDARRDRIYLPEDELAQFGVSSEDILHSRESDNFRQLMEFQIERAENYYTQAFAALPAEDRKNQRPGFIMAAIYRALLEEIKDDACQVMRQRVSLTPIRKLWIGWRTWIRG